MCIFFDLKTEGLIKLYVVSSFSDYFPTVFSVFQCIGLDFLSQIADRGKSFRIR